MTDTEEQAGTPGPPAAPAGLDTNVLLRYLLADDAEQHAAAARLL